VALLALSVIVYLFVTVDRVRNLVVYGNASSDLVQVMEEEDWLQPVDSELCTTLKECRDLGDEYGKKYFRKYYAAMESSNQVGIFNVPLESDGHQKLGTDELISAFYNVQTNQFRIVEGYEEKEIYHTVKDLILDTLPVKLVNLDTIEFHRGPMAAYASFDRLGVPENSLRLEQQYLVGMLIHEYGHLLVINEQQVTKNTDYCDSDQFFLAGSEICFNKDSYMNLFYQAFLSDYDEDWLDNGYDSPEKRFGLYEDNKGSFVSTYASVMAMEDIAESFRHFLLEPYKEARTLANEKVNFFYQFEELVVYRTYVLKELKDRQDEIGSFY